MSKAATTADVQTVDIHGLSSTGAGVGRLPSGRAVFVHRTAPGDTVSLDVIQEKARWAKGRLTGLARRSPQRRIPPCPYYSRCGGCTLQHLSYPAQLAGKRVMVQEALRRVGGLEIDVPPVTPSERAFRYRTRATFHVRRHGARLVFAGFHMLEEPGRILDLDGRCLVLHEDLATAWDEVRTAWGPGARLLPYGGSLALTLQRVDHGVALTISGGSGIGDPEALMTHAPSLVSVWRAGPGGGRTLAAGADATPVTRGRKTLLVRGDGFLQANRQAAEQLLTDVVARAGNVDGVHVVDAYSGVGEFGLALAERGARVTAIEKGATAPGVGSGVTHLMGTVEDLLENTLPAALIVLNPPRTGLSQQVVSTLLSAGGPRLIYVSCDPATLARDLGRLSSGYTVGTVSLHDLFPQTSHVETVAELLPRPGAGS